MTVAALTRRYERLQRAIALVRAAAATTSRADLYQQLLSGVAGEFPVHAGFVGRFHALGDRVEVLARVERGVQRAPADVPADHPLVARLLAAPAAGLLLRDADDLFFRGSRCLLAARFQLEGDGADLLVLESEAPDGFDADDLAFCQDLLATLQATLFNRYSRTRADREIDLLLEVAREDDALAAELDDAELSRLLQKILQIALSLTGCRTGAVVLVDEDSGVLNVEAETFSLDLPGRVPKALHRRADRPSGIVFRVLDGNRSYLANDTSQDQYYVSVSDRTRASLAVPMSFQDRCIGIVVVEAQVAGHFSPEHQRLLEGLAGTATRFVRRAQLYRRTAEAGRGVLIKGRGPAWAEVERRIERAAGTDATVALRGESGTGKELVAHAIHFNSDRARCPFVTVNCAAIPGELLESELFGHVQGAFTGAVAERAGQFEAADRGTIFLDEIGDLPPALQVKLLRVLQSGEVRKVGSDRPRRVDVRVIAATSRDLEAMMGDGGFREDLYYRLMVVPMHLPPLRAYPESIPSMVKQFLGDANVRYHRSVAGVRPDAMDALLRHPWPGNVRELRNVVEQGVLMADDWIALSDLPAWFRDPAVAPPTPPGHRGPLRAGPPSTEPGPLDLDAALWDYKELKADVLRRFEARYLDALLQVTGGNVSRAAELAGVHRGNLHRMLRRRDEVGET
jgi:transcriptional regulator with GAF, ATPase, and Fis domain